VLQPQNNSLSIAAVLVKHSQDPDKIKDKIRWKNKGKQQANEKFFQFTSSLYRYTNFTSRTYQFILKDPSSA
jgi:hypothetical protein